MVVVGFVVVFGDRQEGKTCLRGWRTTRRSKGEKQRCCPTKLIGEIWIRGFLVFFFLYGFCIWQKKKKKKKKKMMSKTEKNIGKKNL